METLGTGAGRVGLTFQIGSVQYEAFEFMEADEVTPVDASGWTFEFFIKQNAGSRVKLFSLTLGNGISFLTYSDNSILITVSAVQSNIKEGEYYFELRRTDLNIPLIYGPATFTHKAS